MRVTGTPGSSDGSSTTQATAVEAATAAGPSIAAVASHAPEVLQSSVLQPALAALRAMPDVDLARVAHLREALARGDMPFDAGKLAGLIERFHGRRG